MDDETLARLRAAQFKLQTKWLRSLPEKCVPLRAELARLGTSEQASAELRRCAHKLRGSAGSFGFTEIGEAAGIAEDAVGDDALAEATRQLLERMMAEHAEALASGRLDS